MMLCLSQNGYLEILFQTPPPPPSERACGVCDPTRPGRRGSQPENSKRARAPALQTPSKFYEKTPSETQKERNGGGKLKKKREIFGPPPFGAPPFEAPPFRAPPCGAKRSAQERPLLQRISHTEFHLDATRQQLVTDIQESEARVERLRALAATADSVPRPRVSPESGNQVQSLQQTVNQLQEERDALARELRGDIVERPRVRQRLSPSHRGDTIPPMPTLIPCDLSDWMQDRHADLQDPMNGGNCGKVLELMSMMSNAAENLAEMTRGMAP